MITTSSHFGAPVSRIGVVGDIHTQAERLHWAMSVLREQRVDCVIATGDIVDGPHGGEAIARVCRLLQAAGALCVLGNHDRWCLDRENRDLDFATLAEDIEGTTREYLHGLPASAELLTAQGFLLLGHGLGSDDMGALYPYDHGPALRNNRQLQRVLRERRYRFVVSGHTHVRMVRKIGDITFINAGSLHAEREPCCCSVLDLTRMRAEFFDLAPDGSTQTGPTFEL
jgi:putative phosphoesterase